MSPSPNILLVTADQWPGALLGASGHPVIETPTLDALAADGTRFTSVYSECPVCIPARRTLMTGLDPRRHGDRVFDAVAPMPDAPTLAACFRGAGYQTCAVGKLHVFPQRDRIGFDDVILSEEGRPGLGATDDYDAFLADQGFAGRQFLHGMSNNEYAWRPWHLPERCHVTNWAAEQMARTIRRRDPTRPAFWYLSFTHPHPPLAPLRAYLDRYAWDEIDPAAIGGWAQAAGDIPALADIRRTWAELSPAQLAKARAAFYALCTHVDHQLRIVIGTLREEGLLDDTAILFTSDHGDMLGDHGLYAKRVFYEMSANVPMILVPPAGRMRHLERRASHALHGLADVMPTLLEMAGIPVPAGLDGVSMASTNGRGHVYGAFGEDHRATRMVRRGTHKLIWYPAGNAVQLFDLNRDPRELNDLSSDAGHVETLASLSASLAREAYGIDLEWLDADGALRGYEPGDIATVRRRHLNGQRGIHHPPPPVVRNRPHAAPDAATTPRPVR